MIKIKTTLYIIALMIFTLKSQAQYLDLKSTIQEQDQWCWSACSKCILQHYDVDTNQCAIADYARSVITWTSFGTDNCCTNPSGKCNYWNYNWGYKGSIQDILLHFKNITSNGLSYAIDTSTIKSELNHLRPFVIRWGWTTGGGHFLVGHGFSKGTVYYMNPWFGEGLKFATYSWVKSNADHTWTHTNVMTTNPSLAKPTAPIGTTNLCQNPSNQTYSTNALHNASDYQWIIYPAMAGKITPSLNTCVINFEDTFVGSVSLIVAGKNINGVGAVSDTTKILVEPKYSKTLIPKGQEVLDYNPGDQLYTTPLLAGKNLYTWHFDPDSAGVINANLNTASINFTNNFFGNAYLSVAVSNNCGTASESDKLLIKIRDINTGTSLPGHGPDFSFYPNPVTGILTIKMNHSEALSSIKLTDINGNQIMVSYSKKSSDIYAIDLSKVATGVYFVEATNELGSSKQKVMVVH